MIMEFKVEKKSKKSRARLGFLKTSHGVLQTPCLVPVATQAVVKTLSSEETEQTKSQILICNTFHLHLKPKESIIKSSGGLHKFMNWKRPLMTDSGGFQIFSLGFGKDSGVGKILKYFPEQEFKKVKARQQPKQIKITQKGVYFKSPLDGSKLFLGPKESIKIQEKLGADIIFAFDECTSPLASKKYIEASLKRTHKWAEICLVSHQTKQALFGIVQGSRFKQLREKSSKFINSLDFDGFAIGGDLGKSKKTMKNILNWVIPNLQDSRPRHLLGIGYLEDIENIIKAGIDTFDCTVATHYARRGIAFTAKAKLNLNQSKFLKGKKSLDSKCSCFVCQNYKRNYISHLIRAKEITGMKLLTFHNLYFFNTFVENIRKKIKNNKI
ncbi:hypothetical protein AMJ47_02240 [Parcubacteria bacterium DG_72]|nr:MAG: hypothetical protein AMJ47_02240 [Parcubacteria bacterium DG_72]